MITSMEVEPIADGVVAYVRGVDPTLTLDRVLLVERLAATIGGLHALVGEEATPPLGEVVTEEAFDAAGGFRDVVVGMTEARDINRWPSKGFPPWRTVRLHGNDSYVRARDGKSAWRRVRPDVLSDAAVAWAWAEALRTDAVDARGTPVPPMPVPHGIARRTLLQHVGAVLREHVASGWIPKTWLDTARVMQTARDAWRRARGQP